MNREIKIVGVISSANKNGNTATLVRRALESARREGASVTEIFLTEHNLNFCVGCKQCTARGSCPLPDDLEDLRQILYDADGIILGSPTYANDYNAIMKNFIERLGLLTMFTSSLGGKYFVGISSSSGKVSEKTAKKLVGMTKLGVFQRSFVTGTMGAQVVRDGVTVKTSENPKVLQKAESLGAKLFRDIGSQKAYPFQNLLPRLIVHLSVRPMFRKYILKNRDGQEKATYECLRARTLI